MKYANRAECIAAGLDPKEVDRIARGLNKYAAEAQKYDLVVFGGSTKGTLRFRDNETGGRLIVAELIKGSWDGGDGGESDSLDGLYRGEEI